MRLCTQTLTWPILFLLSLYQEGNEADLENTKRDNFEVNDVDGSQSMTVAIPGRGFTKVSINTTKIQEKSQALRAIYELAAALGGHFGPYAEDSFRALLPNLKFPMPDVRGVSAQTLSAVFDSACAHGEHVGMKLARKYFPLLAHSIADQISKEDTSEVEVLQPMADSLSDIYYTAYRYGANPIGNEIISDFGVQNANHSVQCCVNAIVSCLKRRADIVSIIEGTTDEDQLEHFETQLQLEESLLTPLVDSTGYTLKFLREDFVPIFEKLVAPMLGPHLASNKDTRASVSAVCLFDDCVEHCGPAAAAKYSPQLLQGVTLALGMDMENADMDLLGAAVYGIAQMARYAPRHVLEPQIQNIIHRLLAFTSASKEEAGENVTFAENSMSALASLVLFGPFGHEKFLNKSSVIDRFLQYLPLEQDEDEAKVRFSAAK